MQLSGAVPVLDEVQAGWVADGLWGGAALRDTVESWAERTPERAAIDDGTTAWSWAELEDAIARAVGGLRRRGVQPGNSLLVVAPLTAPAVAVYLAALRAGAPVVMLDRRCGRSDLTQAAAAVDLALVVVPPQLAEELDLASLPVPSTAFDELLASEPDRSWPEPGRSTPAAAVFTSGTTSRPKAVVHSLDTLQAGARSLAEAFVLTPDDAAFLSSPLASITGLVQTHMTLDRGARLLLEDRFDAAASLTRLREGGATVLGGAPVIVESLFAEAAAQQLDELPLRAIALGGTMIPRPVLELAVDTYRITPVRMYGASEIPCATATLPADDLAVRLSDDGAPARGVELRIAEDTGELLVRGPMRCLGYLDAGDNAAAFSEGGWYRTGDLARIADGRLTVTGRIKEVVARKGMKISLPEVDEAARALAGVVEAAAYGLPDAATGERVVLALYASDPDAVRFEDVITQLREQGLATWKLPEQVDVWDGSLPRTETGKVQRRLLAEPSSARRRELLAPRLR